jgi:hypothetical protein
MKVMIKDLRKGVEKSVPRRHAAVLVALGRAEYVPEKPARAKRQYKRRDMTPETSAADTEPAQQASAVDAVDSQPAESADLQPTAPALWPQE